MAVKIDEALRVANQFLGDYSAENEGFTDSDDDDDFKLNFQHVSPIGKTGIKVVLQAGPNYEEDDPKLEALAQQHVDALKQAHPELAGFEFTTWVFKLAT